MSGVKNFLTNNSKLHKVLRTVLQGVIGVLAAKFTVILGLFNVSPEWQAVLVPLFMAIQAPIYAYLGEKIGESE